MKPHDTLPPSEELAQLRRRVAELESLRVQNVPESCAQQQAPHLQNSKAELNDQIQKRLKVEENLQDYARRLERSNRDLQEFAFVVSHDLQEPCRKIQAFGDLLAMRYGQLLDDTGRDYLSRMQNAAARMQALIEALLAYARVSTRSQPFGKVDLNRSVGFAMTNLELLVEESGARIECADLPLIEADEHQMVQLFQNLIGNSLKFRREGVTPVVRLTNRCSPRRCKIRIQDNGIGFDDKYAERIFDPFEKLHPRDQYPGIGIGLSICRKIVERHGGRLSARSSLNRGAVFTVELPFVQTVSGGPADDQHR